MLCRASVLTGRLGLGLRAGLRASSTGAAAGAEAAAGAGAAPGAAAAGAAKKAGGVVVQACKKNVPQSPWKMNFLVKLARGKWVPDALAQLKFTPKRRAEDVLRIVQRAVSIAKQTHQAIPEELMVKEIFITKGFAQKRSRIMGRGRTGVGYRRSSHVTVKVEKVDFQQLVSKATSANQKAKWEGRSKLVEDIKAGVATSIKVAPLSPRV